MSILHRASGVLLFFAIPLFVYLLQQLLSGESGYVETRAMLSTPLMWLIGFLMFWALMHHLLAGIRYLLIDIHVGVRKPLYRYSAWVVMLAAPVLGLLLNWRLLP